MAKDSSPFHQTNIHPIEEDYSYEASVWGFRLASGNILINFNQSTDFKTLKQMARVMKAELVTVKGRWSFVPAREDEEDVSTSE